MRAFVTGATGFIGGRLAERLVHDGWDVSALVRPTSRTEALRALGVRLVPGDILHAAPWRKHLRDADVVFHAAAQVDLVKPRREDILRTNVVGTRQVLTACRDASQARVVYLSSVAAIGKTGETADESASHRGDFSTPYEESKYRGEQVALEFGRKGLDVVHVLPSVVIGYGDPKTGRLIRRYLLGKLPAVIDVEGMASYVAIEDLVDGILLAQEKGGANERYIFTQANWTTRQLLSELERASGVPPPRRRVGMRTALAVAGAAEALAAITRQPPLLSRDFVRLAARRFSYSSAKARRELGWHPLDFRERLAATVHRYQEELTVRAQA